MVPERLAPVAAAQQPREDNLGPVPYNVAGRSMADQRGAGFDFLAFDPGPYSPYGPQFRGCRKTQLDC